VQVIPCACPNVGNSIPEIVCVGTPVVRQSSYALLFFFATQEFSWGERIILPDPFELGVVPCGMSQTQFCWMDPGMLEGLAPPFGRPLFGMYGNAPFCGWFGKYGLTITGFGKTCGRAHELMQTLDPPNPP